MSRQSILAVEPINPFASKNVPVAAGTSRRHSTRLDTGHMLADSRIRPSYYAVHWARLARPSFGLARAAGAHHRRRLLWHFLPIAGAAAVRRLSGSIVLGSSLTEFDPEPTSHDNLAPSN
jgi:hypothetical protein